MKIYSVITCHESIYDKLKNNPELAIKEYFTGNNMIKLYSSIDFSDPKKDFVVLAKLSVKQIEKYMNISYIYKILQSTEIKDIESYKATTSVVRRLIEYEKTEVSALQSILKKIENTYSNEFSKYKIHEKVTVYIPSYNPITKNIGVKAFDGVVVCSNPKNVDRPVVLLNKETNPVSVRNYLYITKKKNYSNYPIANIAEKKLELYIRFNDKMPEKVVFKVRNNGEENLNTVIMDLTENEEDCCPVASFVELCKNEDRDTFVVEDVCKFI